MPIYDERTLVKVGATGSRSIILPKGWYKALKNKPDKMKIYLDKAGIMAPSDMDDKEIIEHILVLLGESFDKEQVKDAIEKSFDVKIIEE